MTEGSQSIISRRLYDNFLSSVDLPDYDFLVVFTIVVVMDDKGGLGKSLLAQIFAALLRCCCETGDEVIVIDSDGHNSSSYQVDPHSEMLDLKRNREAPFLAAAAAVRDGKCRHVVVDIGAREEASMTGLLPWLKSIVAKLHGQIIVARPITLGSHNQRNARRFMDVADRLDIPIVFVANQGQGREPEYFDDWYSSRTLAEAIELGAVQTEILDFGVRHSDEAIGFGLRIADCAVEDFSRIEDEEERRLARDYFSADICAMLNERLRICMRGLGDACEKAVAKRNVIIEARRPSTPNDDGGTGSSPTSTKSRRKG